LRRERARAEEAARTWRAQVDEARDEAARERARAHKLDEQLAALRDHQEDLHHGAGAHEHERPSVATTPTLEVAPPATEAHERAPGALPGHTEQKGSAAPTTEHPSGEG
jgi:hypothetical protein